MPDNDDIEIFVKGLYVTDQYEKDIKHLQELGLIEIHPEGCNFKQTPENNMAILHLRKFENDKESETTE